MATRPCSTTQIGAISNRETAEIPESRPGTWRSTASAESPSATTNARSRRRLEARQSIAAGFVKLRPRSGRCRYVARSGAAECSRMAGVG